jgi:hypothetical protein
MAALTSVHPEPPDEHWAGFRVENEGFFVVARKIKDLRGGVHRYATQASSKIDAATAKKSRFREETN